MNFMEALGRERLLFDGGMGTMLQAAGIELGSCPEILNVTHAAVVSGIHAQYAGAGARAVETNSLGLNAVSLRRHGLENRLEELTASAVRAAREGVGDGVFVALSVGPTGDVVQPLGNLSFEEAYAAYVRQVKAGAEAGADIIYIETMADIQEARAAILASAEHTSLPVVCSFTYEAGGRTLMGGLPACAAAIARAAGADIVATNCSGGPGQLLEILRQTRGRIGAPMIVQPNAGLPEVRGGKTVFPLGPEEFMQGMARVLEAGASAVGGCCGTTPAHIALLAKEMPRFAAPPQGVAEETALYAQRGFVTPEAARAGLREAAGTEDALYDIEPDAAAALIDVRGLSASAIQSLLTEAAAIVSVPLCFRVEDDGQAAAALRAYCGVAGVDGPVSEETLKRYGAMRL